MIRSLLLLSIAVPAIVSAQSPATRTADSLARDFIASGEAPGIAVAVVRGNDTVLFAAYGSADLENDVAASTESVFRIGSVTKQFTAAAVMQLIEQGKLALDDNIGAHVDSLPAAWRGVTVQQLLNHTSGIPNYTALGETWQRRWGEAMTPIQLLALTADRPMDFPAGSAWQYSNTGYVLLGMLIEKHTGKSWGEDFQTRFAEPLGLDNTLDCQPEPLISHRVHGYEAVVTGWINTPYLAISQAYSAGALCATIGDLVRWNQALHSGRVVSDESYRKMVTPTGAAAAAALKYGFGLGRDSLAGHEMITHGGGINGFASANAWLASDELSVTVLANSGTARTEPLLRQLIRVAIGVPLDTGPTVVPLADDVRQQYVGLYDLVIGGEARPFTIALAGDGLTAQLQGQGPIPLLYYGDHTFGAEFDRSLRLIFAVENGRATGLRLLQGGMEISGTRTP